jgi:histone-lysine N-methyltransferase SETD1
LNQYNSDAASDDESTITENRPASRGSRGVSIDTGDDDSASVALSAHDLGYRKRKRSVGPISRLRDTAASTDDEDEHLLPEDDRGGELGHDLKKPRISRLESDVGGGVFIEGAVESDLKLKSKQLRDTVFSNADSDSDEMEVGVAPRTLTANENENVNVVDDDDLVHDSISIQSLPRTKAESGKSQNRPKDGKPLAGKLWASEKLLSIPLVEDDESEEETPAADVEVSWGVSTTEGPMVTVQDDDEIALDLDGLQNLVKDDEDLRFLKLALAGERKADMGNVLTWAYKEKQTKAAETEGKRVPCLYCSFHLVIRYAN